MMSLKPRVAAARPTSGVAASRRISLSRARVVVARAEATLFDRLGGASASLLGL